MTSAAIRCAVHPSRVASDRCPVCARPRCAADIAEHGSAGCTLCRTAAVPAPPPSRAELVVRAGLASAAIAYIGAWIGAEYVDTQYFATIVPGLLGLACAGLAAAAAPGLRRRTLQLLVAGVAVLGTGLSDRLVPGGQNLFLPVGHRIPPYVAAVVGTLVWPLFFGPVPNRARDRPDQPPLRGTRRK